MLDIGLRFHGGACTSEHMQVTVTDSTVSKRRQNRVAHAIKIFRDHGGILRTARALCLSIYVDGAVCEIHFQSRTTQVVKPKQSVYHRGRWKRMTKNREVLSLRIQAFDLLHRHTRYVFDTAAGCDLYSRLDGGRVVADQHQQIPVHHRAGGPGVERKPCDHISAWTMQARRHDDQALGWIKRHTHSTTATSSGILPT